MIIRVFCIVLLSVTVASVRCFASGLDIIPLNQIKENAGLRIFNTTVFNTDNGMSSNHVNCIIRDDDGIMWFGTNDGLCRYDGHEISVFLPERNNTKAIPGKNVRGLARINHRYLSIALEDGDVTIYDKLNNVFCGIDEVDLSSLSICDGVTSDCSCGLTLTREYIFMAFEEHVNCINIATGEHTRVYDLMNEQNDARLENMVGNDNYVIAVYGGDGEVGGRFGVINTKTKYVREVVMQSDTRKALINDVCSIDSVNLYVATTRGLFVYDVYERKISRQPLVGVQTVRSICKDRKNGYWIVYNDSELMRWSPMTSTYQRVTNIGSVLKEHTTVRDMYEDENGLLWIITTNEGVIKLDTKTPKIKTLSIKSELSGNFETCNIFGRNVKELYAACGDYGVLKVDAEKGTSEMLQRDTEYTASQVYQRKNGDVYVCTDNDIRIFHRGDKSPYKIVPFPLVGTEGKRVSIDTKDICEDCLGNVWFATQKGLFRYNGYKCEPMLNLAFWGKHVDCVYEDSDGRIWVGTSIGSFVKHPQDTTFVLTDAYKINKASNNHTHCFCEYKEQVLIGTASGVLSYDKKTGEVSTAYFNKKFDNTNIYSITTDGNEVLWLSTSSGIGYVDGNFGFEYKFDHFDGLQHIGNDTKKFTKIGNYVYFGNATAISTMNVSRVRLNERLAKTAVSCLEYGQSGEEVDHYMTPDSVYNIKYLFKAGLRIILASSDMSIPSRNQYAYRFDDSEEWMYLGTSNEIILSGLMPGKYKVDVRSTNSDVQWTDTYTTFYVNIIPPMWASTGALIFYGFVILVTLWLLLNLRFRHVNRKMRHLAEEMRGKKALEEQRNRLAKLHKDQTDSISYAKHIQEGIMPKAESVAHLFKKMFVLYMPKDIVSGDFCCFYHRDNITFIIAADCTGHGVSGAFISILGMDHLFNIIMKQKVNDAGKILTALHQETYSTVFKHSSNHQNFNEGMDMTISVVHHDESYIEFAGAMNDLYMIRDNEITTIKGDRYTIGTNTSIDPNVEVLPIYQTKRIEYKRGDVFYMFSDGYVDQFGGPEQKKFKHRRFKHLLLNIHKMPARDQKVILHQRLEDWRGVNEQTDDISVVGFEPWNKDSNR